jgi:hypothetical protein
MLLYFFGTILGIILLGLGTIPWGKLDNGSCPIPIRLAFSAIMWLMIAFIVKGITELFINFPAETLGVTSALLFCSLFTIPYFSGKFHIPTIRFPRISISRTKKVEALPEFNPDAYTAGAWMEPEETAVASKAYWA